MRLTENKFLVFAHVLDAVILAAPTTQEKENLRQIKNDYEKVFVRELEDARAGTAEAFNKDMALLKEELYRARCVHPNFANTYADGICVIVEEIGELAQAVSDMQYISVPGEKEDLRRKAIKEAARVGAAALRFMEMLND